MSSKNGKKSNFYTPNYPGTDETVRTGMHALIANLIVPTIRDDQGNRRLSIRSFIAT